MSNSVKLFEFIGVAIIL